MPKNCKQCFYRANCCIVNRHNDKRPQDCLLAIKMANENKEMSKVAEMEMAYGEYLND